VYIYSNDPKTPPLSPKSVHKNLFYLFFSIIWKMSVEAMNMILKLRIHTGFPRGGGTFLHWSRDVMNMCRLKTGVVFDKSLHGHVINYTLVFSNRQGASPTKQQQLTNSVGESTVIFLTPHAFLLLLLFFICSIFFVLYFFFFSFFSPHFFLCFWTLHVFFLRLSYSSFFILFCLYVFFSKLSLSIFF